MKKWMSLKRECSIFQVLWKSIVKCRNFHVCLSRCFVANRDLIVYDNRDFLSHKLNCSWLLGRITSGVFEMNAAELTGKQFNQQKGDALQYLVMFKTDKEKMNGVFWINSYRNWCIGLWRNEARPSFFPSILSSEDQLEVLRPTECKSVALNQETLCKL